MAGQLRVDLADQVTGLRAQVFYRMLGETGVLRSWVVLANRGPAAVTVESVTSFLLGGLPGDDDGPAMTNWAAWTCCGRTTSGWPRAAGNGARCARCCPTSTGPRTAAIRGAGSAVTSTGTWSSGRYLPMGAVVNRRTGRCWLWQIEHNGSLALAGRRVQRAGHRRREHRRRAARQTRRRRAR